MAIASKARKSPYRYLIRQLMQELKKQPWQLAGLLFLAFFSVAATLLTPWLLGRLIDRAIGAGQVLWHGFMQDLLALALAYAVSAVFAYASQVLAQHMAQKLALGLRLAVFERLNSIPLAQVEQAARGDLILRLSSDTEILADGLQQALLQLFSGSLVLIGAFILMWRLSPLLSGLLLLLMPINFLLTRFIAQRSHRRFKEQADLTGRLNALAEEAITERQLLLAYGAVESYEKRFEQLNKELYVKGQAAQFYSSLTNPGTRFVNNLAYAGLTLLTAFLSAGAYLTIGQMTQALSYTLQFAKPVNEISAVWTQVQNALAAYERLQEVLLLEEEKDAPMASELKLQEGALVFHEVSFAYDKSRPLIEHLNLSLPAKARVAIVGPTGAGKSTLVNLLMRFYELDGGKIEIDGQNIASVQRSSLRRQIGMVLQESWLFSGSVRENIAYACPEATFEEIQAAAKAAHADAFIQRLAQGYDTQVGAGGVELSAGQKQMICIARVFLLSAPVLILDEATSNMDTRTEQLIQRAFAKLMEGRSSFVIAHRLATIREADEILVMDHGHVVEQGSHEALLAQRGLYAQLYESQYRQQS